MLKTFRKVVRNSLSWSRNPREVVKWGLSWPYGTISPQTWRNQVIINLFCNIADCVISNLGNVSRVEGPKEKLYVYNAVPGGQFTVSCFLFFSQTEICCAHRACAHITGEKRQSVKNFDRTENEPLELKSTTWLVEFALRFTLSVLPCCVRALFCERSGSQHSPLSLITKPERILRSLWTFWSL